MSGVSSAFSKRTTTLFAILLVFFACWPSINEALSPSEVCDSCQTVLFHTFQYYRVQTTKRLLRHKLRHMCNRYFEYRRHCLTALVPKVDAIWERMEKALDDELTPEPEYKPFGTCQVLKECDKDHSPIVAFHRAQLGESTSSTTMPGETPETMMVTPDYII